LDVSSAPVVGWNDLRSSHVSAPVLSLISALLVHASFYVWDGLLACVQEFEQAFRHAEREVQATRLAQEKRIKDAQRKANQQQHQQQSTASSMSHSSDLHAHHARSALDLSILENYMPTGDSTTNLLASLPLNIHHGSHINQVHAVAARRKPPSHNEQTSASHANRSRTSSNATEPMRMRPAHVALNQ
jgi:hypothetical protein